MEDKGISSKPLEGSEPHPWLRAKPTESMVLLICILIIAAIFLFDISQKIGIVGSMLYIVPLVLCLLSPKRRTILIIALLASFLTLVAVPLKPPGEAFLPFFNRPLCILIIWMVAIIGFQHKKVEEALKESDERLKSMNEELDRSNTDLRQFAYMASHDLRQPLTTITAYLEILQERFRGKVMDEKAESFIEKAMDGSKHLNEMIDSLLQISRVSREEGPFEPTNMNLVLEQVERNLATSILESEAVITHDELPAINANPKQMVHVLQNLISNGIKFHGDETPRIHVSATNEKGFWQFSVRDNGIGIVNGQQDEIFRMFSRLHSQEEHEGAGIGLAIALRIVERH